MQLGISLSIGRLRAILAADAPALSDFVDDMELDPPAVSFFSTATGVLTWDFHTSATPPAKGAGDIGTGTDTISAGANSRSFDLGAYELQTGYMHFRATNGAGDSNILTSQQITVPNEYVDYTAMKWSAPDSNLGASGASGTDLALAYEGLFNGVEVANSGTGNWRTATWVAQSASNGLARYVDVLVAAGTSGNIRINVLALTGGAASSVTGTLGAATVSASAAGTISGLTQSDLGGGYWLYQFTFTANSTSTHRVEVGPFSNTSGHTIIWLGARWSA